MTELKTKESLIETLRRVAGRALTPEEIERQRVSFIMSAMTEKSGVTRDRVRQVLAEQEGRKQPA